MQGYNGWEWASSGRTCRTFNEVDRQQETVWLIVVVAGAASLPADTLRRGAGKPSADHAWSLDLRWRANRSTRPPAGLECARCCRNLFGDHHAEGIPAPPATAQRGAAQSAKDKVTKNLR